MRLYKVNIIGGVEGTTGFSIHTKSTFDALKKLGVDMTLNQPGEDKNTIMIILPDYWRLFYPEKHKKLIGFCIYEGTKPPLNWLRNANAPEIDFLFAPSKHTRDAFKNNGVDKKIHIIPHGHDPDVFNPNYPKIWDDEIFRFLFVGGWKDGVLDRKGLDIALNAFKEEFKGNDKVKFLAKINMAYGGDLKEHLNGLNLSPGEPEIIVMPEPVKINELARLYRTCDVLVSPSKSEAFGMCNLESLACGTPVITTNWGGQTDYITDKNGWLIDYKLVPATGGFLYENSNWAMPKQEHLQKLMRESYENPKLLEKKSLNALKTAKKFTWEQTAKKIRHCLLNSY